MISDSAKRAADDIDKGARERAEETSFVRKYNICPRCARPVRNTFFGDLLECKSCDMWWSKPEYVEHF
jgi:hypothetical protein